MTVTEFSNEFDISYNSIASNAAPGIDLYEKSVYLTKAQLELVKNYFNPNGNKYKSGFEGDSKRRYDLSELVLGHSSTTTVPSSNGLSANSKFFTIPVDVFLTVQETALVTSTNKCINNTYLDTKPITHDEYNKKRKNPFKRPGDKLVWRLDYSSIGGNRVVELISDHTVTEYKFRYILKPEPIVLVNLDTEYPGEGLSIDGVSTVQTCKLNTGMDREIIDRAVELALVDYKPQNAQLKTQVDSRNE